jgi:hypothetical protein
MKTGKKSIRFIVGTFEEYDAGFVKNVSAEIPPIFRKGRTDLEVFAHYRVIFFLCWLVIILRKWRKGVGFRGNLQRIMKRVEKLQRSRH